MTAVKATIFIFILLALLCSTVYGHAYSKPSRPASWVCYTTGGAADVAGGNINISTTKCDSGKATTLNTVIGFGCALIAILGFGSNFIPVKKFDTGDGMFFQWVLCIGIWLVGVVVNLVRYQPPFFYPVFFGGILWTSGNALVVPIIKTIGLTMGLTIWGATNMLSGWFTGMFILKQHSGCKALNFAGVGIVIISTIILSFVKSEGKKKDEDPFSEKSPLIDSEKARVSSKAQSLDGSLSDKVLQSNSIQERERITFSKTSSSSMSDVLGKDEDYSWVDKLGKWPRKIVGLSMALGIGFLFGTQFLAVEFMRLCEDDTHSCNELDYIFGHFTGIFLVSTFWFAVYSLYMRNRPKVYPKVILPALASGIIWGIAMTGWFVANENLSLAVSFPIITAGPGFISSAWGILLYREIKGWKNISLYFGGFFVSVCGVIMVALSNNKVQC